MAMIFGDFDAQSDEVKQGLFELVSQEKSKTLKGAETLFREAARKEPGAHLSTFGRSVHELAHEAFESGFLDQAETTIVGDRVRFFVEMLSSSGTDPTGRHKLWTTQLRSVERRISSWKKRPMQRGAMR